MKLLWGLLLLTGCAQVTSLNLKKHQFGILPSKIIWFQIAGFEEEQLAMLRFQYSGEQKTAFEDNTCIGKSWAYNFYDLRPEAQGSFLSQMTGKKNIKLNCEDAAHRPIWSYLQGNGYATGILESKTEPAQSLLSLTACGETGLLFLSPTYFWKREKGPAAAQTYHPADEVPLELNQIIYNRSCDKRGCFTNLSEDYKAIYQRLERSSQKHLLIVRDFSYLEALESGRIGRARDILLDLERAYAHARALSQGTGAVLVLLTSGESRMLDLPDQGKGWFEFEKTNKNVALKRTKLSNLVLASGARAENFCGLYEDHQIFERILSGPKQQGLELQIINPFK